MRSLNSLFYTVLILVGLTLASFAQTNPDGTYPVAQPVPPRPAVATKADLQQLQNQVQALESKLNEVNNGLNQQAQQLAPLQDKLNQQAQQTSTMAQTMQQGGSDKDLTAFKNSTDLSINMIWVLICGFLVMFMQAGFAMVETGLTRAKNAANTMAMNFVVYGIAMLGYWACGFAFAFGGNGDPNSVQAVTTLGDAPSRVLNSELGFHLGDKWFGLCGNSGYFLSGSAYDGGIFALFLFEMMFTDVTALIPTGAMAERWKFLPYCIFSFFVGSFIYPLYSGWIWSGGWLAALGKNYGLGHGVMDFAGSSVVHLAGGTMAFVGASMLGARLGKYGATGTPNPIPGHNLPMAMIGTFILAFGWFGFNAGSTLAGTDLQIGIIATNTMLASGGGTVAAMLISWLRLGKPDASMCCNGMLAGQVAITASGAFVDSWAAVLTGVIAGLLLYFMVFFVEEKLRVDDPVAAISVHGACGLWGMIGLGLFANGKYGAKYNGVDGNVTGLFYGDATQLYAQLIGIVVCIAFVAASAFVVLFVIEKLIGNRVSAEAEMEGLDIPEMGTYGYNNE